MFDFVVVVADTAGTDVLRAGWCPGRAAASSLHGAAAACHLAVLYVHFIRHVARRVL